MKDLLDFVENHYCSLYILAFCTFALKVRFFAPKGKDDPRNYDPRNDKEMK